MFNHILIVCIGNICRSPMGEGLLQAKLPDITISSAGISALVGYPADPHSVAVMRQKSIDISTHLARQIDDEMVANADLILTMEKRHNKYIQSKFIGTRGKVHLIGRWLDDREIADPVGRDERAFSIAMANIERGLDVWAEKIIS
ncbi:MAG: low molecular weight phosphotyrosine protein phosphatase [Cocleimonas sp.]|nr:low molecular weight phosphotyrosine protein phosphatase [Cocleimonas sp.]